MNAYLAGLGVAVPDTTLSNAEALQIAYYLCSPYVTDANWLTNVYEHCGVQTRHQSVSRTVVEKAPVNFSLN